MAAPTRALGVVAAAVLGAAVVVASNATLVSDGDADFFQSASGFLQTFFSEKLQTKICAMTASSMIGAVGILPLFVLPFETKFDQDDNARRWLRMLLGFACGGLLGDVFFHILPEAAQEAHRHRGLGVTHLVDPRLGIGFWVLVGVFVFLIIEKVVDATQPPEPEAAAKPAANGAGAATPPPSPKAGAAANGTPVRRRPIRDEAAALLAPESAPQQPQRQHIEAAGIINLLLNTLDNFTHGLAIAAAFVTSLKVGTITTIAILLHEVPHEIGDFAILIQSGFSKRQAIVSQFMTSIGGLAGTSIALCFDCTGYSTAWILPFTAGGFIYVSLVSIAPELLSDFHLWHWSRDVLHVTAGAALVGAAALYE